MFEYFILALLAGSLLMLLWSLAWLICSEITFRQRMRMLAAIGTNRPSHEFWLLHGQMDKVSYNQHQRAVFFLRDPIKLYGKELQEVYHGLDQDHPEGHTTH